MKKLALYGLAALISAGCSSNMSRFDVVIEGKTHGDRILTRGEVGAQGSGNAFAPGGHSMSHVTIGGSYSKQASAAAGGTNIKPGLYGNPNATE